MMKPMSFSETIFLFVLALIVFGPKKLPEIARQVGKVLNEFRRASNEFKSQIEQEIANLEVEDRKRTALPASSPPEGTASRTLNASSGESSNDTGVAENPTPSSEATTSSAEPSPAEAATLAASAEATIPANHSQPATEALPTGEVVTSSASQESHV
jgi:sec-independent protein translocase protein TatB